MTNLEREELQKELAELKEYAEKLKKEAEYYSASEQALKLVLNGSYGAFTAKFFILYHEAVGGTITAQGRELTQTMERNNREYWYEQWHLDTETHKRLCINNVNAIDPAKYPVSIYADTDSIFSGSYIDTSSGKKTIEKWFNENISTLETETSGHETVRTEDTITNFDGTKLYNASVNRIIRHKVTKAKWKICTKSGKEIYVTNDHSMIVFRDGEMIEVKPSEILKTDKLLTINQ